MQKTYTDVDTDAIRLTASDENGDLNLSLRDAAGRVTIDLSPEDALDLARFINDTFGVKKTSGRFFEFSQNNSGGSFSGPAVYVYIEADNADEANDIAERDLDIYFDGVDKEMDCACCGDSWRRAWGDGISEEEMLEEELEYRKHVERFPSLYRGVPATYIHRKDK